MASGAQSNKEHHSPALNYSIRKTDASKRGRDISGGIGNSGIAEGLLV
jgi:hypothetical protein